LFVQGDKLAVENRVAGPLLQRGGKLVADRREGAVNVPAPGHKLNLPAFQIGEGPEAVVLQFVDAAGIVEGLGPTFQRQWGEPRQRHGTSVPATRGFSPTP
jgi:hypothetical protein